MSDLTRCEETSSSKRQKTNSAEFRAIQMNADEGMRKLLVNATRKPLEPLFVEILMTPEYLAIKLYNGALNIVSAEAELMRVGTDLRL